MTAYARGAMSTRLRLIPVFLVALVAAALVVAGCGDSGKPEYCSNVSDLQQSVGDLGSVNLEFVDASTLQADVQQVQRDADAVVSSAKQDFPSETSALESSVSRLATAVGELSGPRPAGSSLASPELAQEITSVVTAAKDLSSATSSACD